MWHFLMTEGRARGWGGLLLDGQDEETCPAIPHVKQETLEGLNADLTVLPLLDLPLHFLPSEPEDETDSEDKARFRLEAL